MATLINLYMLTLYGVRSFEKGQSFFWKGLQKVFVFSPPDNSHLPVTLWPIYCCGAYCALLSVHSNSGLLIRVNSQLRLRCTIQSCTTGRRSMNFYLQNFALHCLTASGWLSVDFYTCRELCAAMSLCYTEQADVRWIFTWAGNFALQCLCATLNRLTFGGFLHQ